MLTVTVHHDGCGPTPSSSILPQTVTAAEADDRRGRRTRARSPQRSKSWPGAPARSSCCSCSCVCAVPALKKGMDARYGKIRAITRPPTPSALQAKAEVADYEAELAAVKAEAASASTPPARRSRPSARRARRGQRGIAAQRAAANAEPKQPEPLPSSTSTQRSPTSAAAPPSWPPGAVPTPRWSTASSPS